MSRVPVSCRVSLAGGQALVFAGEAITTTITYTYDPLYRLTAADYDDGTYYHYAYDAVGNRLSETTQTGSTSYLYDDANRLTSVGGITYTWDNNGNLLSDEVNTYIYNHANRLISISNQQSTISNAYNGLGNRVSQTVNGVTTNYSLDLAAGLTQVLSDGTHTYLYGVRRIAQHRETEAEYFLADGLGSVRQLLDDSGGMILAKNYRPYGEELSSVGSGYTSYGFTGEITDPTGLIYLRARYYAPFQGRFLTRDIWPGEYTRPLSLNGWNYVEANPVNRIDPTGKYWWGIGQGLFDASTQRFQNQNIHIRIQAIMMAGRMNQVHAEYDPLVHGGGLSFPSIPGAMPIDLLDSITGEIWEIKPWEDQTRGLLDLSQRILTMNEAKKAEVLYGTNPIGMPYNWNYSPLLWLPGQQFPTHPVLIGRDDTGWYDIFAAQTQSGLIAWWKYKRNKPEPVPYPILLPDSMLWNERNTRPGWRPDIAPAPIGLPGISPPKPGEVGAVVCTILIYIGIQVLEASVCGPCWVVINP